MPRGFFTSFWKRLPQNSGRPKARRTPTKRRAALGVRACEERQLLSSGLVAAYNFDAGSGNVLTDVSGNGNNGTISNATWSSAGKFGGALSFNGSTSIVKIADSTSLNLTKGMTLEAWVDPTSLNSPDQGWCAVISKEHVNSPNDIAYALYAANGTGTPPAGHILVNGNDQGAQGGSVLPLNHWSFLATTYDGTTLRMYVNGTLVGSQRVGGGITTTSDPLCIGGDWSNEMFSGLIDNVRIYNTALSQSSIQSDMNTAVSGSSSTAPTVTSVSPANGATGVSTTGSVTVTFSEAVDPTTVTTSTIQLTNGSGQAVAATVSYSSSTDTATLTPSSTLANGTTYSLVVHGGTSGSVIKDLSGNPLAANYTETFTTAAATTGEAFPNNLNPPPLPAPTGTVINVSTVSQLQNAVANLKSNETIVIAAGTYKLTAPLYVPQNLSNIAIRGATGKASDVVIQGDAVLDSSAPYSGSDTWGSGSGVSGSVLFGIWLGNVQGVTVGDLTLTNFVDDAIILNAGVQSPLIHNVTMLDTGEQLLKSNPDGSGGGVNNGVVEYCTIGYTTAAPNNYTNGIDVHTGQNWVIRNNLFKNIYTTNPMVIYGTGALAGPAILMWHGSQNATAEGNTFINCQREIAFGLNDPSTITNDNSGGIIENNYIYRSGTQHGDVAIGVWNSPNTVVAYNTVILNGDYADAIEYRYATTTGVKIEDNLTDAAITARNGATGTVSNNVTNAQKSWFVNEAAGNLELTSAATGAIGHGLYLSAVPTDYSGETRPSTGGTDVGADEYTFASQSQSMSLTPATLPGATVNSSYSVTLSASGGSGSYTYAVTSASLPSWLTLNGSTGLLSGTPTGTGSYSFTITATDASDSTETASKTYTLTVNAASGLTVTPATLPAATADSAYSVTLSASGGSGSYTFAVTAGSLPSWLTLNGNTGVLSGTPTSTGSYSFTITATDAKNVTGSKAYTLTVNAASSLAVTPATLPSATANSAYSATLSATGGSGSYTFAVTAGSLPSWLTLNGSTGVLSGTPTSTGSYSFTITATDAYNSSETGGRAYTLTVNAASSLTVTPAALPSATAASGYTVTLSATGGSGSYSYGVTAGSLPAGLTLNGSTGTISGTPTAAGSSTFTVTATDTANSGLTGSHAYTLTVNPAGGVQPVTTPYITTPYLTIPNFGAKPTIYSVASGNWSNPAIWSLGRVPGAGDIVDIEPGTTVTYDLNSTVALNTLEIQPTATLTFATGINTTVNVGNFLVLQGGSLVVGTSANPIASNVQCTIELGNQAFNNSIDPNHFGNGLIALGNVTMYGAVKTPYVTLAQEAHAGDTVLHLASPVTGWQPGDDPILPDTQQLPYGRDRTGFQPTWERVTIKSISADGLTVYLTAPLKYDHLGVRDAAGVLQYLPQVVNDSRNIMLQSASFTGIRGYTLFTDRANVDIEYAGFCELGRTTNTTPGGTNVADRYAMTMLDLTGPTTPQANGHQFTLIGNEVDNDGDGNPNNPSNIQWGIALNNSYYGLISYNDVWGVAGVGIGVEDGSSSYNVFDHNFVGNVTGTAGRLDQQLQGDGFWFGNPNNYVSNNIATDINGWGGDVYSYGFDIDAKYVGTVTVPSFQGADPSVAGQSTTINMNDTPILQFSGNEVYGATPSGMTLWWIGTFGDTFYADAQASVVKNFVAWDIATRAFYGYPTNNLTIDGMTILGDASYMSSQYNLTEGINFDDYMTHNLTIENCNIQDMWTGIRAPYNTGRVPSMNTTVIQNCYLDNVVNIDISPPRSVNGSDGLSPATFDINNVQFDTPAAAPSNFCANISMDYLTADATGTSNMKIPQYVYVTNYNGVQGDNFQVFYKESNSPTGTPPSNAKPLAGIDGLVAPS
jgi:hypothetical protein